MTKVLNILLVEDNLSDAILLEECLRSQQVKIEPVSRLADGLSLAKSRRFDAILLDLGLPDSSGLETLLSASNALPDVPIIILTGMEDEDIAMKAVAQGAQDYLVKGRIDERSIVRIIRYAIERKRAEDALEKANEELEQRVQERTADLSHAIDSLQAEVEGRILAEQALRDRSNQLRELASELTLAEQRERRRMAKILHDDLQQLLVGARFQLSPLQRFNDRIVQDAVRTVNELLGKSVEISRTLTSELSPPILYEGGLIPALEWLGRWMQEKHGLIVQLESDRSEADHEPDDVKVLLFEAARELLLNIVKYAGVNTAYIQVKSKEDALQLTVKDEGRGLDPAELTKRGFSGGHGLFGIRERVESFGGSLLIDSSLGHGSSFVLVVPVQRTSTPETETRFVPHKVAQAADVLNPGNHKIRVLLADDHAVVRKGLTYLLSSEPDIEVVSEASDGEQALDLARQFHPDVLLMDINMPKMNGIEATRIIHSELPGIRVIGLSMFEEAERAAQMREAGAVAYVSKSGQSGEVIAAIRAAAFQNSPRS